MNFPDFVQKDVDLGRCSTLALPGRAAFYAEITESAQLMALLGSEVHRFVLGGGSNLVLSGDFGGLILHMAISGRELLGEDADAWYVRAGAGENWHEFVQWTVQQGWPGLENLALIPGTVGAAPIQNIGAYGLEVCERFHSLSAFDMESGKAARFDRSGCRFGYRDSVFKQNGWHLDGRFIITEVTFRLPKAWKALIRYADVVSELEARRIATPEAQHIFDAVIRVRQNKLPDPAQIPNAGSFFQNPVVEAATADRLLRAFPELPHYAQANGCQKLAAGWLIEQAGWKGRNMGPVGMFEKQAVVLVNRGRGAGGDVLALMQAVQRDVRDKFGVDLMPEPVFL